MQNFSVVQVEHNISLLIEEDFRSVKSLKEYSDPKRDTERLFVTFLNAIIILRLHSGLCPPIKGGGSVQPQQIKVFHTG